MHLYSSPHGSRLPALESNIVKYRAMEMILVIFHAEELRRLIIDTVRVTDSIRSALARDGSTAVESISQSTKRPLQRALRFLVSNGSLSEEEKAEIEQLVDYRNHVAHRIHHLVADIGNHGFLREYREFRDKNDPQYDYKALTRLRFYRKSLPDRLRSRHVMTVSLAPLLFRSAEKAIDKEIRRLSRKIDRQLACRKHEIAELQRELSLQGTDLEQDDLQPYHPANQYESGNLTKRGVEIWYRLYDLGKSPLVAAHLMRISLNTAAKRKRMWQAAGGRERSKTNLEKIEMLKSK